MDLTQATKHFVAFLKHEQHCSPHTIQNYALDLHQFSQFLTQKEQSCSDITAITAAHIRHYLITIKNLSPSSRCRKLSTIRSFFAYLFQQGWTTTHVGHDVQHPKRPKLLPKPVHMDLIYAIIRSPPNHPKGFRNYVIFLLLFGCGLRIGELRRLTSHHISDDYQWIRIQGKGQVLRDIPLPIFVAQALKKYLIQEGIKQNASLFPGPKGLPISSRTIERIIDQIAKPYLSQYCPFTPHQLRHSFASHLLASGAQLKGIQELLGHRHLTSTEIYTHIHTERLSEVIDSCHPASLQAGLKKQQT